MVSFTRNAALASVFALSAACAQANMPLIEFKGLRPGGDGTPLLTHAAWSCKAETLNGSDTVCFRRHETIAGAEAKLVLVGLKDGKILSLYVPFAQTNFTQVNEAITLKYGQPQTARTETKTTRMGAEFRSRVAEWRQESIVMRLEERAGNIDQSALSISSDEASKAASEQRSNDARRNKSDL